jgi:hypothetical protein
MTRQRGHATAAEQAEIERMERDLATAWDPQLALDLAQLYIDPFHEEEGAIAVLHRVLAGDGDNPRALYWLTYAHRWGVPTDEALAEAARLVPGLRSAPPPWDAAGVMLEVAVLEAQMFDADMDAPIDVQRLIPLCERSVHLAPGWVQNRQILSAYYEMGGRRHDAAIQLRQALANLDAFSADLSLVDEYFHLNVTGLVSDRAGITEDLARYDGE